MIKEERCKCGYKIPKGYGYYKLGKEIKCKYCGRFNKRKKKENVRN